jgi:3-oxoacyl-[acyl-carrier protein] reductase
MELNLDGKRALVTGSSSGIGAAIARTLASEGVEVVVHGRDEARARAVVDGIARSGGRAALAIGDVSTADGAAAVAKGAMAAFGGIDILVNNVGGPLNRAAATWFDIPVEEWNATLQPNLIAPLRLIHALAPGMRERGWGRIIQISSRNAVFPRPTLTAYAASKAALNSMSIALSKALAHTGVTVNTISPGLIYTPMFDDWCLGYAKQQNLGDDLNRAREYVLKNVTRQTVSRVGQPEDIARVVVFLASPHNDYVNGADFAIDGGAMPAG